MTKTFAALKLAWDLLRDGYGIAVGLIAAWPQVVFWLFALLLLCAVL